MSEWITDWSQIRNDQMYVVCPINKKQDGSGYYLAQPNRYVGWQIKQSLRQGCYAALPMPDFKWMPKHDESKDKEQEQNARRDPQGEG